VSYLEGEIQKCRLKLGQLEEQQQQKSLTQPGVEATETFFSLAP
jgi:hypothetical protein